MVVLLLNPLVFFFLVPLKHARVPIVRNARYQIERSNDQKLVVSLLVELVDEQSKQNQYIEIADEVSKALSCVCQSVDDFLDEEEHNGHH